MKIGIITAVATHMLKGYASIYAASLRHGPDMDAPYYLLTGSVTRDEDTGQVIAGRVVRD